MSARRSARRRNEPIYGGVCREAYARACERCDAAGVKLDGFKWYYRDAARIFNTATLWKVFGLAQILSENQPVTVRGAMYRGIGTLWPDSSDTNYNTCANLILKMRRAGLIPYPWIVDGTRVSDKPTSWSGLADYAETVADAYRKDLWERQSHYLEIFVEKDAMSGVIRPVTREYDVRLNAIRGYGSETFLWNIAEEWKQIIKPIQVYYLGDHDPAGLAIEKDLQARLNQFCGFSVKWNRIAVTDSDFFEDNEDGIFTWQGFRTSALYHLFPERA